MKKKTLYSNKGFAAIGIALLLSIFMVITIYEMVNRARSSALLYNKAKATFDAEKAIEEFAIGLKSAYEDGDVQAETNGKTYSTTTFGVPQSLPVAVTPTTLTLAFPNGANKLCFNRSDNRDTFGTINKPICITAPTSFSLRESESHQQYVHYVNPRLDTSIKAAQFVLQQFFTSNVAQAQTKEDPWAPDALSTMAPATIPTFMLNGGSVNLNPASIPGQLFKKRFGNYDCNKTAGTSDDKVCMTIQFCVRYDGVCNPDEMIHQTYVFLKAPQTSLRN